MWIDMFGIPVKVEKQSMGCANVMSASYYKNRETNKYNLFKYYLCSDSGEVIPVNKQLSKSDKVRPGDYVEVTKITEYRRFGILKNYTNYIVFNIGPAIGKDGVVYYPEHHNMVRPWSVVVSNEYIIMKKVDENENEY